MGTQRRMFQLLLITAACSLLVTCLPFPKTIGSFSPAIAYDRTDGRYLVVFVKVKSERSDTTRIAGVFIDSKGAALGNEFVISEEGTEYYCPSVAYDDARDRFIVVWNGGPWVFGQFVNADGTLGGPRMTLAETAHAFYGHCASVVYDGDDKMFLAAWGEKNPLQQDSVYAQLLGADGTLNGPKLPLSDDGAVPVFPSTAYDSVNHRFFTVWDSHDNHGIKGRMINSDGTFVAKEFFVHTDSGQQFRPTVSFDGDAARFLVSWEHCDECGGPYSLLGQLMNVDGTTYQSVISISTASVDVSYHASVYDLMDKKYFLVFGDYTRDHGLIYGQAVMSDGALDTTVFADNILLSYADYSGDRRPAVAFDGVNDRFYAVWSYGLLGCGYGGEEQFGDIHGRLVHPDGTPAGPISVVSNGGAW